MSRADVRELGETLDAGQAGLVVVGRSNLDEVLDRQLKHASKRLEKAIRADADALDAAAASSG